MAQVTLQSIKVRKKNGNQLEIPGTYEQFFFHSM